jgi:hypothetical protein
VYPPIVARQWRGKIIVARVVFRAVRFISKENRRLVLGTSCFYYKIEKGTSTDIVLNTHTIKYAHVSRVVKLFEWSHQNAATWRESQIRVSRSESENSESKSEGCYFDGKFADGEVVGRHATARMSCEEGD